VPSPGPNRSGLYVEPYDEEGEFEGGRVWVVGDPEGSKAGIAMKAEPELSTHSYSHGYALPPWFWDDRSRVYDTGVRTCVPVDCFDNTLVIEEFERPIRAYAYARTPPAQRRTAEGP
jgi:hypothetical protein